MSAERIIARGAEALLIRKNKEMIKRRIRKSYRLNEIDEKLRKRRTRQEARLIEKASAIISVPKIIKVDENKKEILMEFIKGKRLADWLDKLGKKCALGVCFEIGRAIALLHNSNIIHGDLTTSNMILKDKKIFFVDFGLGFNSKKIEDKAVDLHLLRQALESRHFLHWKEFFNSVIEGYGKESHNAREILTQLKKVEARGRYKH